MADRKNQGPGHAAGKKPPNNGKTNLPSVFNRSMTVNSSASSAAAAAALNKPLYGVYTAPAFQRNGSVKGSYGSTASAGNSFSDKVRKLCSIFESPKHPSPGQNSEPLQPPTSAKAHEALTDYPSAVAKIASPIVHLPGTEDRVVVYFTSLRGIRRTFQDCHNIRLILRGFRVNLDERDISMDSAYRKELQKVLGQDSVSLPQVFIKGRYIGGAEVVKHMLEVGELARMIKGLPLRAMKPCDACDDFRFIPCTNCDGSRKLFDEYEEQPRRCPECNENGLVRCPLCCA
ncbi:glutaredoxin family protein [Striga asiatica]|uniref:Glutaredoxin family protein n=1 Tax=Striga asiatica TaxID=4170 RepID=A0A5A7PX71_STRAF|nr:glutaredoxin family protein [Striga asiatica]